MKKIILIATALLLLVSVAFATVNYKEKCLTPNPASPMTDSTRAQAVATINWQDVLGWKLPNTGLAPAMIRVLAVTTLGDTDCDSTTVVWLTSPDRVNYIARDSAEFSGNTAGDRALFTANIEDSVFQYNMIIARPQCNDAAAAAMAFDCYFYLYDGLGQLVEIKKWLGTQIEIIAGGGI